MIRREPWPKRWSLEGATTMPRVAFWTVAVFVFSIPYENGVEIAGVGSLARIIGMVAIGVTAISLFDRGTVRLRAPSLFLVVAIAYAVWGLASYFWSIAPTVSVGRIATLVQLIAMVWMVHQVAVTERQRSILAQAYVFGAFLTILIALSTLTGSSERLYYRDVGGLNPNWFAIGCAFAIPLAWGLALRTKNQLLFWLNALYPAFAVVAVVLAASRGGLITTLFALLVIPLTLPKLNLTRRLLTFAVLAAFVWGAVVVAPQAFPNLERNLERLGGTAEEIGEGTLTGRTIIWEHGIEAFRSSPIAGLGVGTFSRAVVDTLGSARGAHNAYLSVAVGSGMIGLFLFLGMIALVTVGVLATRVRRIEFLILIGALVIGMTPANMEHTKSIWFLLSWLAAARPILIAPASSRREALDTEAQARSEQRVASASVRSRTTQIRPDPIEP